jgi:hypothetical protein
LIYPVIAAAALVLVVVGLWKFLPQQPPTQAIRPTAETASLESAEILDMGDVDTSVTSVVRSTSGSQAVTVVVIVNQ